MLLLHHHYKAVCELFGTQPTSQSLEITEYQFPIEAESQKMSLKHLQVFDFPVNVFKLVGLWPRNDWTRLRRVTTAIIFQAFPISFTILQIFGMSELKDLQELPQLLAFLLSYFAIHFKIINLTLKMDKIQILMRSLKDLLQHDDWLEGNDCDELLRNVGQINKTFRYYLTFALPGTIPDILIPLLTGRLKYKMYMPKGNHSNILLGFAGVYQLINSLICVPLTVILDFFPAVFLSFAVGLYEELHKLLEAVDVDENPLAFKRFVEIELKIRKLVDEVVDCFSTIILVQAFLSSFILCMSAFSLSYVSSIAFT